MPYKKRICFIFFVSIALITFLACKLFFLQVFFHDKYYKQASGQRLLSVKLSNNRGMIYDRNLIPMVETKKVKYAVVYPDFIKNQADTLKLLNKISGKPIKKYIINKKPFSFEIINQTSAILEKLKKNNVLIIDGKRRYGEENLARHVIGYVSEKDDHGKSGVESICDKYLYSTRQISVGVLSNAKQKYIGEFEPRYLEENYFDGEFDIKLTLDYHIQKIVEDEMKRSMINGAVVVLDNQNGNVLAMASKPDFEQDSVEKYLNKNGTQLINRAIKSFNVGSIFKIITASTTLQEQKALMNDYFYCNGGKDLDGHFFKCSYPHGYLSLIDAFAVSCNSAFIELGLKVGKTSLIDTSKKFGLGSYTNLKMQGFSESPGQLPYGEFTSNKESANFSIGQGEVLATPVQIASLVSIIANNGIKKEVNLIDSVIDSKGRIIKNLKSTGSERVVSIETAWKIKKMMEMVTEKGTGKKANIPEYGGSSGKTGTAQTGWKEGETTKVHAWFAGYFPRENPEYTAVVFVEDGKSGSNVAAPIFGNIAREVMKLKRK
ncbi:MAG: peptidoglycan D,D-transpeptidase FtsI family protein [Deltaproteobacteria bacterium]